MNDSIDQAAVILRVVADFLRKLPDEQRDLLISGRARLVIVPPGSRISGTRSASSGSVLDLAAVQRELDGATSREQAVSVVKGLKLRVADLRQLAKDLGIPVHNRSKLNETIDLIVDGTVGARLTDAAIRTSY